MRVRALATLVAIVGLGVVVYAGAQWWRSRDVSAPPGEAAADDRAPAAPAADSGSPDVKLQGVTIYQRAATEDLQLVGVPAQVVWMTAPADRARQVAQLVLEGVPGAKDAVPPGPPGIRYRDVLVTTTGIAWIDLDGSTLAQLEGSDEEQGLVAALARSLTEALPDVVKRVGFLVDGQPRASLAGHVDLKGTYTGREWPVTGAAPPEQTGDASR